MYIKPAEACRPSSHDGTRRTCSFFTTLKQQCGWIERAENRGGQVIAPAEAAWRNPDLEGGHLRKLSVYRYDEVLSEGRIQPRCGSIPVPISKEVFVCSHQLTHSANRSKAENHRSVRHQWQPFQGGPDRIPASRTSPRLFISWTNKPGRQQMLPWTKYVHDLEAGRTINGGEAETANGRLISTWNRRKNSIWKIKADWMRS